MSYRSPHARDVSFVTYVRQCSITRLVKKSLNYALSNCLLLSVMITLGIPNLQMIDFQMNDLSLGSEIVACGTSTTTTTNFSCPLSIGKRSEDVNFSLFERNRTMYGGEFFSRSMDEVTEPLTLVAFSHIVGGVILHG